VSLPKAARGRSAQLDALAAKVQAARIVAGLVPPAVAVLTRYLDDTPEAMAKAEARVAGSPLVVIVNKLANRPVA
jgi:hypothetical protein